MSVLSPPLFPPLPSTECMQTLQLQHACIEQLELEREQLEQNQQKLTQNMAYLTQQLLTLAKENKRLQQENNELNKTIVGLSDAKRCTEENKELKKDLKECVHTMRLLNKDTKQVVDEQEKIQKLFEKNQEEKEKLKLTLEKIELEERKIKIVNHLDRLAYFTTLMVALTVFVIFGVLSAALISGGVLFICYQWSKKGIREELENNLRAYSKAHLNLSEKDCLRHLYPSFQFK